MTIGIIVRDGLADHRGFTSFQFVKFCVEERLRLAVAEAQHSDDSYRGESRILLSLATEHSANNGHSDLQVTIRGVFSP